MSTESAERPVWDAERIAGDDPTVERPDLSALPYELRVRVEVATTQGWVWKFPTHDNWMWTALLLTPDGALAARAYPGNDETPPGIEITSGLPDYLHDPAAWGALEEAEQVEVWYNGGLVHARCALEPRPECCVSPYRAAAVCFAVLAKHGIKEW